MSITWNTPVTAPASWANVGFGTSVSHTFTGMNGGTAYPAGAYVVVAIATRRGDMGAWSGVTIGGVTAAPLVSDDPANITDVLSFWGASLPSGGTDSVVATTTNPIGSGGLWSVIGAIGGYFTGSATAPTASGLGNFSNSLASTLQTIQVSGTGANTTISVPTGGIGIAAMYSRAGVAATSLATPTWGTGGTSNITASGGDLQNGLITNPDWLALAHTVTAGSWGPTETSSPANASNSAMVAVTFAPAGAAVAAPRLTLMGVG